MTSRLSAPDVYTDFEGIARLRADARANAAGSAPAVAEQFEALFIQMMLKNMREASAGDELFASHESDFYRDLHDQQLALTLAQDRGIGLKDIIARQIGAMVAPEGAPPAAAGAPAGSSPAIAGPQNFILPPGPRAREDTRAPDTLIAPADAPPPAAVSAPAGPNPTIAGPHAREVARPLDALTVPGNAPPAAAGAPAGSSPTIAGPQNFVQQLWPHAREAARQLGVAPEALLAQAALETGWGRSVIAQPDGTSSYNLFGIKAAGNWNGKQASVPTLEYAGGVPVRSRASFRVYDSYAESFQDYVQLVRDNPRYRDALRQAGDPGAYLNALQSAGYATDPAYANKIVGILGSDALRAPLDALKNPGSGPLTG